MNLAAIRHRSTGSDCYALDSDTVVLNLWTDHSVKAVSVVSEDPMESRRPCAVCMSWRIRWCGRRS